MLNLVVEPSGPVNLEALDAALRAALGSVVLGVSAADDSVHIHLRADASPDAAAQARSLAVRHDPAALSPRQQAERDRRDLLAAARRAAGDPLEPDAFADPRLRALAQRVVWLALEIEALRAQLGEA
ncbi:MAG: hypothetical protein ACUVSX_14675 [Aggregatilineales bacterium]